MNIDVRQCENLTEEQLVKKKKFEELMAKQENERYEQK